MIDGLTVVIFDLDVLCITMVLSCGVMRELQCGEKPEQ